MAIIVMGDIQTICLECNSEQFIIIVTVDHQLEYALNYSYVNKCVHINIFIFI